MNSNTYQLYIILSDSRILVLHPQPQPLRADYYWVYINVYTPTALYILEIVTLVVS